MSGKVIHLVIYITSIVLLSAKVHGIQLTIEPNGVTELDPQDVLISCQPLRLQTTPLQILFLRISRPGESPIATVHNDIISGKSANQTDKYEVKGHIDDVFEHSYLNVTMLKATPTATGTYECEVFYLNLSGEMQQEKESVDLKVDKPSLETMEGVMQNLMEEVKQLENAKNGNLVKITSLQTLLQSQANKSSKEITSLKETLENQQKQTNISEKKVVALQQFVQAKSKASNEIINELQKKLAKQQNQTKFDEKNNKYLADHLKTLEKINTAQKIKVMSLETSELGIEKRLNETQMKMGKRLLEMASKKSVDDLNNKLQENFMKSKSNVDSEFKKLAGKHTADAAMILKKMTSLATKLDVKHLSDKEANDAKTLKQLLDKSAVKDKEKASAFEKRVDNLELYKSNNDKAIKSIKKEFESKINSAKLEHKASEKLEKDINRKVQKLTGDEISIKKSLKNLEDSGKKHYNQLKAYIDSSIRKKHPAPPKKTPCRKHGLFGKLLCKNKG